jgi:hypothetical protein
VEENLWDKQTAKNAEHNLYIRDAGHNDLGSKGTYI